MKEMEQYMKLRSLRKLLASQPLKKMVTQLLVSVSIFSLVFSWSSLSSSSPFIYYEKLHHFSGNSLQLLSIAMNKNCIFLICNGILVFIAKTTAFVRSPSAFDLSDMLQKRIGDDGLQMEAESEPVLEKQICLEENGDSNKQEEEEEEEDKKSNESAEECSKEKAEEVSISIAETDEEGGISEHEDVKNGENEQQNRWFFDDDEEEDDVQVYAEEEDDETEKLSTEELNQKFEDFIRRMKEEFRISETRQQLVMVN